MSSLSCVGRAFPRFYLEPVLVSGYAGVDEADELLLRVDIRFLARTPAEVGVLFEEPRLGRFPVP